MLVDSGPARVPLTLYGAQLALNWMWTPIFFGFKKLGLVSLHANYTLYSHLCKFCFCVQSLIEISGLYATVLACTYSFYNVDEVAGMLMVPYIAWLSLATALTYRVWRDNKDNPDVGGVSKRD